MHDSVLQYFCEQTPAASGRLRHCRLLHLSPVSQTPNTPVGESGSFQGDDGASLKEESCECIRCRKNTPGGGQAGRSRERTEAGTECGRTRGHSSAQKAGGGGQLEEKGKCRTLSTDLKPTCGRKVVGGFGFGVMGGNVFAAMGVMSLAGGKGK